MISIKDNSTSINMSNMSNSKTLSELWEDETEAFLYGLNHKSVIKYINNANIEKRNYSIYSSLTSLMLSTLEYKDKMKNLIKEYMEKEEDGTSIGMANYVLENLEYQFPDDKLRIAYALGKYVRYNADENS